MPVSVLEVRNDFVSCMRERSRLLRRNRAQLKLLKPCCHFGIEISWFWLAGCDTNAVLAA
jgi:hypothetical protein